MELINNIEWYFDKPENAKIRDSRKLITNEHLYTVVFDNSIKEDVSFCLPLNEHFLFSETRSLKRPITVKQILNLIYNFYNEPLNHKNMGKAFENNEDWKEEILDIYDGDCSQIINYEVFVNINCVPDFCGLELNEDTGEYFVSVGPE
jgi:hypothetical protein